MQMIQEEITTYTAVLMDLHEESGMQKPLTAMNHNWFFLCFHLMVTKASPEMLKSRLHILLQRIIHLRFIMKAYVMLTRL